MGSLARFLSTIYLNEIKLPCFANFSWVPIKQRKSNIRNIFIKKQQKYFGNVKVIVIIVIMLSSSDEFRVATPDETAGKDTEFSLVGCFRNTDISRCKYL